MKIAILKERASGETRNDLLGLLLDARDPETGRGFSDVELCDNVVTFIGAGHETTANFIANGVLALLRHPEQLAAMREDRVDMKLALEEFMRYDGPGKTVVRVASEDFEFEGQQIRKGQRVFLMLSVANRDPLAFEDAELLKLDRVIAEVEEELLPNRLCTYLFELSQVFNRFSDQVPVLKAEEPARSSRLALCRLTADTLRLGLGLLGIPTLERM